MKHFWTDNTIRMKASEEGISPHEWILQKEKSLGETYDMKWSASPGGGGYSFYPIDDGVEPIASPQYAEKIVRAYWELPKPEVIGYVTYLQVWSAMNTSMKIIMGVVKWMEKQGFARRTVDRMGKVYAFKLTNLCEKP